jgi:hypothetical protein
MAGVSQAQINALCVELIIILKKDKYREICNLTANPALKVTPLNQGQ